MSRTDRAAQDLADAAAVHAAREEIVQALGPLAASPLDEQAADRMRQALERVQSAAVRCALRRLAGRGELRPPLVAVPAGGERSAAARSQAPPLVVSHGVARLLPVPSAGGAA